MVRDTSIEAYNFIRNTGILSQCRWVIYNILYHGGPLTRNEIHGALQGIIKDRSNVSARLCEMRDMGCVREVGERVCPESGMNILLWDVTSNTPEKFTRENLKKKYLALLEEVERLRGLCTFGCFQKLGEKCAS